MSALQEQLDRLIKRVGEQDPLVQMLRNQIMAEQSGKNFQELYLTGSVSTPERFRTIDPNSRAAKLGQAIVGSLNATVLEREKERNKTKSQEE